MSVPRLSEQVYCGYLIFLGVLFGENASLKHLLKCIEFTTNPWCNMANEYQPKKSGRPILTCLWKYQPLQFF